jgi:hypothetical protein
VIRQLTAAASRFTTRKLGRQKTTNSGGGWQEEAWDLFSVIPEVRFAATWIGNAMGGARLYAGRRLEDGTIEKAPDGHPAAEIVSQIAGGPGGQSQFLAEFGPHLVVAGEAWIIIRPTETGDADWRVLSVAEVKQQQGTMTAEIDGDEVEIPPYDPDATADPDTPVAIRVWDPHPRRHIEADSPVRSSLVVLEELRLLNAAVAAAARSRLVGRGVLLFPTGVTFPTAPGQEAQDDLVDVFMEVASTAYREPESAAGTVPIILQVPGEMIGQIQHLKFESDFDEIAIKLRDECIRRFATGLETPPEVLLGMGGLNHWGAWLASAEGVRLGVEPRLTLVSNALTTQWLRPLLEAQGATDAAEWLVWHDTSQLRVQANRAATALEAFQAGLISAAAARRETGFDESDAPTAPASDADDEATDNEGDNTVTTLPVSETQDLPDTLPAAAAPTSLNLPAEVLAAVDGIIYNALYAAGTRLRNRPVCPRPERARAREIAPAELHTAYPVDPELVDEWRLFDGAWTRVPEIAKRYGLDPDCLTRQLDDYARALIAARMPHSFEDTARIMRHPCQANAA